MPFSSRLGFYQDQVAVGPSAILPDYPNVPTESEYIAYLGNLSATSATVFVDNQTPNVTVHGSSMVPHPDEDIYLLPREAGNFVRLDTATNTFSDMTETASSNQFQGGTLGLNGKIYLAPFASNNYGEYDPATDTLTTYTTTGGPASPSYYGALTLPDGDILLLPRNNHKMIRFTPGSTTVTQVGTSSGGSFNFGGFCLAPNGMVYVVPENQSNVYKYDYTDNSMTSIASGITAKYTSCAVDNTGNVIGGPHNVTNFLHIDTGTDTVTTKTYGLTVTGGTTPYTNGATHMPNGNVLFVAFNEESFYEINGNAETGTRFDSSVSQPRCVSGAFTINDSVYTASSGSDKFFRFDTNANTSVVSSNIQFTYSLTPVGSMSE